jgi:chorismate mutase
MSIRGKEMLPDLADRRRYIDEIDLKIVDLLNQRAQVVAQIAHCKRRSSVSVVDEAREQAVLERVFKNNAGPLGPEAVSRIFRTILRESRRFQKQLIGPARLPRTSASSVRKGQNLG